MIYIISDIHLGSDNCLAKELLKFLQENVTPENCEILIINGDLFNSMDCRLKKSHWAVLSYLRKISNDMRVVWVKGNHDYPDAEISASILGIEFRKQFTFEINGINFICIHGDCWDEFTSKWYWLTVIADSVYTFLQKIDKSHNWANFAKNSSKIFARCCDKIRERAIDYCQSMGYDYIICGHTHYAEHVSQYYNCGAWAGIKKPSYVSINKKYRNKGLTLFCEEMKLSLSSFMKILSGRQKKDNCNG